VLILGEGMAVVSTRLCVLPYEQEKQQFTRKLRKPGPVTAYICTQSIN